ncbi:hypothetical protein SKAU_G00188980 [Synaphobranchus kaupii]|uniref:Uncharacterized protein n=1 Tax=Synaphobranchus kaupii TaxID=118154 RepID=A0A9Q1FDA8_SYNKA|nr:hypothetical protein SKAU_G00188980 [Synaphobranchus kaupii]
MSFEEERDLERSVEGQRAWSKSRGPEPAPLTHQRSVLNMKRSRCRRVFARGLYLKLHVPSTGEDKPLWSKSIWRERQMSVHWEPRWPPDSREDTTPPPPPHRSLKHGPSRGASAPAPLP